MSPIEIGHDILEQLSKIILDLFVSRFTGSLTLRIDFTQGSPAKATVRQEYALQTKKNSSNGSGSS